MRLAADQAVVEELQRFFGVGFLSFERREEGEVR
jgi:hypothetical protein